MNSCVFKCLSEALPVCMFEGLSGLCWDHDRVRRQCSNDREVDAERDVVCCDVIV